MANSLLMVGDLPPPVHGSNVMADRCLRALQANGYEIVLIEKKFSRKLSEVGKASVLKMLKVPLMAFRLVSAAYRNRTQLCLYFISVNQSAFLVDALMLFLVRLCRLPYVLYFHGKGYRTEWERSGALYRSVMRMTLAKASAGLVIGENLKEDVNLFIPDDRLFVLPNCTEDIYVPDSRSDDERSGPVQVLFLANLVPTKGPMEFLRMAYKVVSGGSRDVRFVLAGPPLDEVYSTELEKFVGEHRLDGIVDVPGGVYGEAKRELFHKSDIFVFPTRYEYETFGIVIIEAMQCGLPVVSSNVGAIPEIVRYGINGFIVRPGKHRRNG